jgi:hypothetical protein
MKFVAAILLLTLSLVSSAAADVFVLSTGGQVEGELLNANEQPREKYVIKTSVGELTLRKDQIKEVIHRRPAEVEYDKVRHQYPDTAEGQWTLAEWCREQHLREARERHLKRVIELDPDHAQARGALGFSRVDGQWKTQQQVMTERGYVEYKGRWRLPQEVELMEQQRKNELAEKSWFTNIRRWRNWLESDKRPEALRSIVEITDPQAIPSLKRLLEDEADEEVRTLAIEALSKIGTPQAQQVLAQRALEDTSNEVRLTCLDYLVKSPRPEIVNFFIQKLRDKDNVIVNRAGVALSQLKDPIAIGPLVDALVTTHKFQIGSATGGGGYSASFGTGGTGFSTGGGGPKIVTQSMPNPAVLEALVGLTRPVDYGYEVASWKRWLASQRKAKVLDARRG